MNHFDGKRFRNQTNSAQKSGFQFLSWFLTHKRAPWPKAMIASDKCTLPKPQEKDPVVTFISHATCLIQTSNVTIITDPHFSDRASPFSWAGPKRAHEPGIPYEDIPPIDVVIISHNHYDHMDKKTLQRLQKDHNPLFLVGLGNEVHLKSFGITSNFTTLDWYKSVPVKDATITFVPAQHFSGRKPYDLNRSLWGGFVIDADDTKLFFAGDTGYGPHFKEIQDRFGPMDLSLIPIGAYSPTWLFGPMHISPEEAVKAHLDLKSRRSVGIHFQTFRLTGESFEQPVIDLQIAKQKYTLADDAFVAPRFGESFIIATRR